MKPETIQQEILLFAGTSFSSKEYCLKDPDNKETPGHSPLDNLEKACWNGMLNELLPELADSTFTKNKPYIWHIMQGDHFLNIQMGNWPALLEKESSIDPYFFLPTFHTS